MYLLTMVLEFSMCMCMCISSISISSVFVATYHGAGVQCVLFGVVKAR